MSELFLTQRDPGPLAIQKGIDSLLAGLRVRHPGYSWEVVSPPDCLKGANSMRAREVDGNRIIGPDDESAFAGRHSAASADEDMTDRSKEVA